ncbi:hypothetical protein HH303_02070 [Rhodospirillaceae bacterium KN72]|uniref:Peptidoglycan binding-like domain-containing protein n=1 Tax=Pacificispira spongiicola TaxID=2729598 RepID=A0A7Y0DYQ2_9PROT|nr:peptidoglycan-binding protein [Pacificispira spongiicola]NMM43246.1 hypothetical protein [Pacificispira spongiicola]
MTHAQETPVFARRAAPGCQSVRGRLVESMQRRLTDGGYTVNGIDGIFGAGSERGLKAFQADAGLPPSGVLDGVSWSCLFPEHPVPETFDLCLALTGTFEGHGYGLAVGNFDGAGVTWGIIGFTLASGELATVLGDIEARAPGSLSRAFGGLTDELRRVLGSDRARRIAWADSISLGARKYRLREDWARGFARLGATEPAQAVQSARAREKFWRIAVRDAERFGLTGPLGHALCFDIAVQNGGINEIAEIRAAFDAEAHLDQRRRREIVAEKVAMGSREKYRQDVLNRKRCLALGSGTVHGSRYTLADWGLSDDDTEAETALPSDLALMPTGGLRTGSGSSFRNPSP